MEAWIAEHLVPLFQNLFNSIGWPGVVIIMALESANIPIPSEITMPLAGWLLTPRALFPWWEAALITGFWGALGCTIGSIASYALGYWGGRPLVVRYGRYILVTEEDVDRFDHWFQRWGDYVSFISRVLPIVRTFISFPGRRFQDPLRQVHRPDLHRFLHLVRGAGPGGLGAGRSVGTNPGHHGPGQIPHCRLDRARPHLLRLASPDRAGAQAGAARVGQRIAAE
ncbi:DedA family protein [Candidatus Amarolinea dominans]|uniref:DedA family protein n=1 Tax=Candidatus Amarolinea dominans TaxID=3140696 RepID=UPI003136B1A9|nr:DedA family protein [Anaerolineae bacterium]